MKSEQNLTKLLQDFIFTFKRHGENECPAFKSAKSDFDFAKLGKYFSALSSEANLKSRRKPKPQI